MPAIEIREGSDGRREEGGKKFDRQPISEGVDDAG